MAAAGGNDALTAAVAAGGAEAVTPIVSNWLYDTSDAEKLTADQKQILSAIASLAGAGVGAISGDVGSIISGSQAGQNAVDNNEIMSARDIMIVKYGANLHEIQTKIKTGKLKLTKELADYIYTLNHDDNLTIVLPNTDVMDVVLPKEALDGKWRSNPGNPNEEIYDGHVAYMDYNSWSVFGHVTVSRDKVSKGGYRVVPDTYDFDMKSGYNLNVLLRNAETTLGRPGKRNGYKIIFTGRPNVIYK